MKAVMLSIRPKWVEKILNGKKTYEVRKTRLPLNTPIYVYCTKSLEKIINSKNNKFSGLMPLEWDCKNYGKIVAKIEFDDYKVITYEHERGVDYVKGYFVEKQVLENSCIDYNELLDYGKEKTLYFHHISKVEIIEPKEIGEFISISQVNKEWLNYKNAIDGFTPLSEENFKTIVYLKKAPDYVMKKCVLTKAPQSYCYVEVKE